MKPFKLALLGCSSTKLDHPAAARELDLDGASSVEGELLFPENVWEMVVSRAKVELGEPEPAS